MHDVSEAEKGETTKRQGQDQHETRSVAFAYDGSAEGLMSCVFHSYACHVVPQDIARKDLVQPRLDQEIVDIPTNIDQAFRVRRGIVRCGGRQVWKQCLYTTASDDPKAPYAAFRFIRQLFDVNARVCRKCKRRSECRRPCSKNEGPHILDEWANPHVEDVLKISRSVANEINRMHELIRFSHLDSDIWFARCNPNANVVPFLMSWFAPRFNTQRFLI